MCASQASAFEARAAYCQHLLLLVEVLDRSDEVIQDLLFDALEFRDPVDYFSSNALANFKREARDHAVEDIVPVGVGAVDVAR